MREDFLHFIWRLRRFSPKPMQTTEGASVEIVCPGDYNTNAGPDFLNAKVKLDGVLWAGQVEMHLRSSDWSAHQHQDDPAYDNVILHVVLEEDQPIYRESGERISCLNLRPYISPGLTKRYLYLLQNENWIPCQHQYYKVPTVTRSLWLDRLLVERLETHTTKLSERLIHNQYDWEETFYHMLARGFGLRVNAEPMQMLAERLPLKILLRHKDKLTQLEALLFGQAGLLDRSFTDAYPQQLQQEFAFLRHKYQLEPLPATVWKYMRMRPANFPTIRIAQLATLLLRTGHLLSKMLVVTNLKEVENAFAVELSNYWQTHYRFDKTSKKSAKALGRSSIHLILINIVVPFLFFYGKEHDQPSYQDRAMQLLEEVPAESNHLITEWKKLGEEVKQAAQSQALLQLYRNYCQSKQCLHCAIGGHMLKLPQKVEEEATPYLPPWWLEAEQQQVG